MSREYEFSIFLIFQTWGCGKFVESINVAIPIHYLRIGKSTSVPRKMTLSDFNVYNILPELLYIYNT